MKRVGLAVTLVICVVLSVTLLASFPISGYSVHKAKNVDALGREIALPVARPDRIVSLSPGNTEIIFALGGGDRLVGVTTYCNYPAEAASVEKIGGYEKPDVEKIILMRPDIVFAGGTAHTSVIKALTKAGIPVVAAEPQTLDEVLESIALIADSIGEHEKGMVLVERLQQVVSKFRNSAGTSSAKIFIEIWDRPLLTVGGKSYINDIVNAAGGYNVAGGRKSGYALCDRETLFAYNPDIYIIAKHNNGENKRIFTKFEQDNIKAIRENKVYYINDDYLDRPGPRSFLALEQMAQIIQEYENSRVNK